MSKGKSIAEQVEQFTIQKKRKLLNLDVLSDDKFFKVLDRKSGISENELNKQVIRDIEGLGGFAWRQNSIGKTKYKSSSKKGVPDNLACLPVTVDGRIFGCFVCVESKGETARLQDHQKEFLSSIRLSGGIAIVAGSVNEWRTKFRSEYFRLFGKTPKPFLT